MSFDDELRQIAAPVALHEAGHLVVARALDFPTAEIYAAVSPFGGGAVYRSDC